jgi:hypothetical protein
MRSEVLTVVLLRIQFFWDVTCREVCGAFTFKGQAVQGELLDLEDESSTIL